MPVPGGGGLDFYGSRLDVSTANIGTLALAGGLSASGSVSASETALPTTNPTSLLALVPLAGNLVVLVYFRVTVAATVVTITITYTDTTGAQTITLVNAISEPVGSYSLAPVFINATAAPVTVNVTAGTANQVFASASMLKV